MGARPKHKISKDTVMCISIAQYPSNFGTTLFNAAFESLGLDFVYKAFRVTPEKLGEAVRGIRALGIRGCGVSMPFKSEVIRYLDGLEPLAAKIGMVNTIVNTNGRLRGYNTDCYGAMKVLGRVRGIRTKSVLLLGAGGAASAIACALAHAGIREVMVANRSRAKGVSFARRWGFITIPWAMRNRSGADILINATPLGMAPRTALIPVNEMVVGNFAVVMDVVVNPLTSRLIALARKKKKTVIPGYAMSVFQAAKQFELYTGKKAPAHVMEKALHSLRMTSQY